MTPAGQKPPASLAALRGMIVGRELRLGRREEAVLRHLVENPAEAAFGTCQSIAQRCKVSAATVDRLAIHLGYGRFADFRDLFRQSLRGAAGHATPNPATFIVKDS